jgi:pilus assembly protein FimV
MVRKLAGVVFAVSALHASVVSALGLGEIELRSGLNQPLRAEIALNNLGDLNQQQIAVKLAGADDFNRAGVERIFFLSDLKFSVQFDGKGSGVIKVSSTKMVREPYLDFVLEARWPEGRLLREYTLLVDLPTFSEEAVAAPAPAVTRQAAATPAPVKTRVPAPAPSAASLPAAAPVSGEIVTRSNDTLWGIAAKERPAGASMQQAMMAIYDNNRQAFSRQNINGLRRGQVLRLPSAEQIDALTKQQAIQAVALQNEAWKNGTAAPLEASEATAEQEAQPVAAEQSYMKLSSSAPGSDASSSGASAGADDAVDNSAEVEGVRSELVAAQEKLDRTSRENEELDSRLDGLEEQVDTLDKLVELKDSQLAALQARMEQEGGSASAPVDMNFESAAAAPTVASSQQEPGLVDRLMSPMYLGGIGALVLLGVAGLVMRRRSSDDDDVTDYVAEVPVSRPQAAVTQAAVVAEAADEVSDNSAGEVEELVAAMAASEETAVEEASTIDQDAAPFDPLSEADIYCSYDRHDEAVSMLQRGISDDPDRHELHLKLLSILADLGRESEFVQVYNKLAASGSEDSLQQAQLLVANTDWLAEETVSTTIASDETSVSEELDNTDLDFDLDFDIDGVESLDNTSQQPALDLAVDDLQLDGDGLDFDLDVDNAAEPGVGLDDLNFDIELGDGDDQLDATALAGMLDAGAEGDAELSEMVDGDEIGTKLDLARAYVDMGDVDGARDILEEVLQDGTEVQVQEASELLRDLAG